MKAYIAGERSYREAVPFRSFRACGEKGICEHCSSKTILGLEHACAWYRASNFAFEIIAVGKGLKLNTCIPSVLNETDDVLHAVHVPLQREPSQFTFGRTKAHMGAGSSYSG